MTPLEQIEINKNYPKLKKALEIIKEKRVDFSKFFLCDNLEIYNRFPSANERELTQEEYDLLKEVLCKD